MIVVLVKKFNERFCVAVLRRLARRRRVLAGMISDPDVAAFYRAEADAIEKRAAQLALTAPGRIAGALPSPQRQASFEQIG